MGKCDFSQKRRCGAGPETNTHAQTTNKRNWVSQTTEHQQKTNLSPCLVSSYKWKRGDRANNKRQGVI